MIIARELGSSWVTMCSSGERHRLGREHEARTVDSGSDGDAAAAAGGGVAAVANAAEDRY